VLAIELINSEILLLNKIQKPGESASRWNGGLTEAQKLAE